MSPAEQSAFCHSCAKVAIQDTTEKKNIKSSNLMHPFKPALALRDVGQMKTRIL